VGDDKNYYHHGDTLLYAFRPRIGQRTGEINKTRLLPVGSGICPTTLAGLANFFFVAFIRCPNLPVQVAVVLHIDRDDEAIACRTWTGSVSSEDYQAACGSPQ